MSAHQLVTEHLDLWTRAVTQKSTAGRGRSGKVELTGIKKLRELILELAVRGKLVEQDPDDEPASVLLEQVANEKAQLAKVGKIKKSKKLPDIDEEEKPFGLPDGWLWARMEAISEYIQRGKGPKYAETGGVRVVSQKCVQWSGFDLSVSRFVDDSSLDGYQDERYIRDGDVLWNSTGTGTVGRAIVIKKPQYSIVADSHVTIVRLVIAEPSYVLNYISSPSVQHRIEPGHENSLVSGTTKQVELNSGSVKLLPVPLPPLKEQHRIVQKVDELMALCDRLEQYTSDQLDAHETLVDSLLGTLTQSANATELADNWARLAEHFDTLFTTEQSIDKLMQTILQLAVMGRLVEQDEGDEPAIKLLKRVQAGKDHLSQQSRQRKAKPLPEIAESEEPFSLPSGWVLARLDDITDIQGGIAKGKKVSGKETRSLPYLRVANVQRSALNLSEIKEIEIAEAEVERYLVRRRDLLITEGGDWDKVGRTAIWDGRIEPMAHQNHVFRARLILREQNERWLERYLNSQFARDYFASSSKQTTNLASINKTQLRSCTVPLPPLEEQHRIVQKVDELMALCDHLKDNLTQASDTRCQLAGAVVEDALN